MHLAAKNGHTTTLQFLIDNGYYVDDITKKGNTPADIAKINRKHEAYTLLIAYKKKRDKELIETLLADKTLDVCAPHKDLFYYKDREKTLLSPYLFCVQRGVLPLYLDVLETRSSFKADSTNQHVSTALHLAAEHNQQGICSMLIKTFNLNMAARHYTGLLQTVILPHLPIYLLKQKSVALVTREVIPHYIALLNVTISMLLSH